MVIVMVSQYVIYGERHSGTKFLQKLVQSNLNIVLANNFQHKHFFTPDHILKKTLEDVEQTVFLCIVRNPYDWILAFHKERHHCGIIGANNLYTFMSKSWISRQPFLGPEILSDRHLYNGTRYKNIFHMRSTKNMFMYSILPIYVKHHMFIKYEDFLQDGYADYFIKYMSRVFRIKKINHYNNIIFRNKHDYYHKIDTNLLTFINNNIDWSIENQIGYHKALDVKQLHSPAVD